MELKEFIKAAITDITDAVYELQKDLNNGTIVNPTLATGKEGITVVLVNDETRMMERLNFDIAVTVSETTETDGKVKAGISIFGAKLGTESTGKSENVSRMTFSIPLLLPATHVKTPLEISRERRPKSRLGQQ